MRVAIVGSRHFSDPVRVIDYVKSLPPRASIITGSASGVDAAATKAAREKGIPVQVIPASFDELADVYAILRGNHPALPEQVAVRAALNQEFADWNTTVAAGDEVVFIPPVSGGF